MAPSVQAKAVVLCILLALAVGSVAADMTGGYAHALGACVAAARVPAGRARMWRLARARLYRSGIRINATSIGQRSAHAPTFPASGLTRHARPPRPPTPARTGPPAAPRRMPIARRLLGADAADRNPPRGDLVFHDAHRLTPHYAYERIPGGWTNARRADVVAFGFHSDP